MLEQQLKTIVPDEGKVEEIRERIREQTTHLDKVGDNLAWFAYTFNSGWMIFDVGCLTDSVFKAICYLRYSFKIS